MVRSIWILTILMAPVSFSFCNFLDDILMIMIRKYLLSIVIILGIWVVCLLPVPETPLNDFNFIDKWTHFVMYGVLSFILWYQYLSCHLQINISRLLFFACVCPVIMGGLVELAQAYLTTCRSGDWFDALCNALGALMGNILGFIWFRFTRR